MRRSLWVRALIGIWGLWFTAALSEVGGIHACAVHDGHAASAHSPATAHGVGHDAMATAMRHDVAATSTPQPTGHQHGGACTCLGMCCCGAPVAIPSSTVAVVDVAVVEIPPPAFADAPWANAARTYAQPFANGPPAAA